MGYKYDASKPPKKVRKDKPGDSPKNYLNPFRTQAKKSKATKVASRVFGDKNSRGS